jgi:hypothetical protein
VARVGVDTDELADLDADSGLLLHLARDRVLYRFAGVDAATGQCPEVVVGLVDQEQRAGIVEHRRVTDRTMLFAAGASGSLK